MAQTSTTVTIELMELLNEINRNVNDVRERLARIEAQTHAADIIKLEEEIKEERKERQTLQLEVSNIKTRLAPIFGAISIFLIAGVEFLFMYLKG